MYLFLNVRILVQMNIRRDKSSELLFMHWLRNKWGIFVLGGGGGVGNFLLY